VEKVRNTRSVVMIGRQAAVQSRWSGRNFDEIKLMQGPHHPAISDWRADELRVMAPAQPLTIDDCIETASRSDVHVDAQAGY